MSVKENKNSHVPHSIRPLLDEVAERLRSNQAAVMVGAGFSKNAYSGFPDGNQLGDVFYEKIHGKKPDDKNRYLNVSKLAEELEATSGRDALDKALREAIPEGEPSPLHIDLLNLPWTDVLTTNYDMLLEKASAFVTSRKYDIVVNQDNLVHSEKPRIIKLHGSFQSERRVITEDDYRQYEKDFPLFDNTVKQVLLENTLCLIGFSGDDRNFLEWAGWIQDNLGSDRSPGIYLVDVDPSASRKSLLKQRNISLIDMSECVDIGEDEYYNGLNRFIKYLLSKTFQSSDIYLPLKKEDNRFQWPRRSDSEPADQFINPDRNKSVEGQVNELLSEWQRQRSSYPGWVVLPEDLRNDLWGRTRPWIDYVSSSDDLPEFVDLKFVFELNWRMQKCLCPILDQQIRFFESVLDKYWNPENWRIVEEDIATMCISLLLSTMRFYREEGLLEKWEAADEKINCVFEVMSPEQRAVCYYERSLFALFGLDIQKLRDSLKEWKTEESLPFFEVKRASLLAETGQIHEAEEILEKSLKNIRAQLNLKPIKTDYSLVSQESIIMVLLQYVQMARFQSEGKWSEAFEVWDKFSERLNVLKQYKCDLWNETKFFRGALSGTPAEKSVVMEKQSFDIGRTTQTIHFEVLNKEALIAYQFLRFCEDTAVPFGTSNINFGKDIAKGTLSRIYRYSPYWAKATLLRVGEEKAVDHIFNRESLTQLNVEAVDALIDKYLGALEKNSKEIQKGSNFSPDNFEKVLAKVLPEILSRLCCKCSLSAKNRLISFLLKIYKSAYRENYDGIDKLTKRLLNAFTVRQRFDLIPKLLDFPFPQSYMLPPSNPFVFLDLDEKLTEDWAKPLIHAEKIEDLFKQGLSADRNARQWAIFTLGQLHLLNLLTPEQSERFAEVLWGKLDDIGLPDQIYDQGHYYRFAFVDLPHPPDIDPISLFKNYILGASFYKESTGASASDNAVSICRDIVRARRYLEWSDEEAKSIFQKIVKCWDNEKSKLRVEDSMSVRFGPVGFHTRPKFEALVEVLVFVVAPNFDLDPENKDREELLRLIGEFCDYDLSTLRLKAACLHIYPDFWDQIFEKIENGLVSNVDKTVADSLGAVLTIITDHFDDKRNSEALLHFIDLLGQMIFWQKKTLLHATIGVIKEVIEAYPSLISGRFEKSILIGLKNIADNTDMDIKNRDFSEALFIREKAAGLAYRLFTFYVDREKPIPKTIKQWQATCQSEVEFSEIRNQWITNDQEENSLSPASQ